MENQDNLYWLFSSSAQAVSAFVALLLAGYTLFLSMLDRRVEADPTLAEIVQELKTQHHARLGLLCTVTGGAILSSLAVVYYNNMTWDSKLPIAVIAIFLDVCAVIGGLRFVVHVTRPVEDETVAQDMIQSEAPEAAPSVPPEPGGQAIFFMGFVRLESTLREWLQELNLYESSREKPDTFVPFRSMVHTLFRYELIDRDLRDNLLKISKYRNLVFHGHVDTVDGNMTRLVKAMQTKVSDFRKHGMKKRRKDKKSLHETGNTPVAGQFISTGFSRAELQSSGFAGWISMSELKKAPDSAGIPSLPGVYIVYRESEGPPEFEFPGKCGPRQHRDPSVSREELEANWVPGAHVLYLGQTIGSLQNRIAEYMKAGQGKNHGHWGGRYIWQLQDCDDLLIAWKPTPGGNPHAVEKALILKFEEQYGRLPFANLRRG